MTRRQVTTPPKAAIAIAKKALRVLGKEDLLFVHGMNVHARPGAYERLARFFEEYRFRCVEDPEGEDPESEALRLRPDQEPR